MKSAVRTPFFEIGVKNYLYGDAVVELAWAADGAAAEYDIDILFITPYVDIRRIAECTDRLIILAPYMDTLRPGRGLADVLPEGLKAAGAHGVVINHAERPVPLAQIRQTIDRANELDLLTFACADTVDDARAIAVYRPDILNPEPSALIGSGRTGGLDFMRASTEAIQAVSSQTLVEQGAGIATADQVHQYIAAGADGVGVASGIVGVGDPIGQLATMLEAFVDARALRPSPTKLGR
ncbi:triose-phosphate isomerase [Mycolicibacterium komossense]|uniref:Triose-phosphate isomerase n=1 Tax=Mycolicibacterium komossense TaxID=1779 RepID=A0ABT3C7D7_9MYCO|nr:triose-phosphate isomerase [Mycolicibacterium komossense]MCV7225136.1 triose-phosphate isomerase [Mycolicibacterium komossense]